MIGIAGAIALGLLALAVCGLVMMLAIAFPVMLVNLFRDRKTLAGKPDNEFTFTEWMSLTAVAGLMAYVGVDLFRIFLPTVRDLLEINVLLGAVMAVLMSVLMTCPMIGLFVRRHDRKIEDLNRRIQEADTRLDFDESHRLLEELEGVRQEYEKRKNTVIYVLICTFMTGFFIWYLMT